MAADDARRWDDRYVGHDIVDPAPPDALVAAGLVDLVATGSMSTALDVACGAGAQAVWAATFGLDVIALDVSPEAVRLTGEAAAASGVADRVHPRVVDLDDGIPPEYDDFDLVVCQRFRDPAIYDGLVGRLAVGGVAVITVLSVTGTTDPGPFHAPPGELRVAFNRSGLEVLDHREATGTESIVVRRIS